MKALPLIPALVFVALGWDHIATAAATAKPNFIVILCDDLGYQDLGCFGSPMIKTPCIDRMAEEGKVRRNLKTTSSFISTPSFRRCVPGGGNWSCRAPLRRQSCGIGPR